MKNSLIECVARAIAMARGYDGLESWHVTIHESLAKAAINAMRRHARKARRGGTGEESGH